MLIGLFSPDAMADLRQLQVVYPKERLVGYEQGEFLCKQNGALVRELDGSAPTRLTFLDHVGSGVIGGGSDSTATLTAEDFADLLIAQLNQVKRFHGQGVIDGIKDLDLLGCEGGTRWTDSKGIIHESIAEVVARRLNEAGYGHIKVHTLTPAFLADSEVTATRIHSKGTTFEFYGFNSAGIEAVDAAADEGMAVRAAYKQFCSNWHHANADFQRVSAIPYAYRSPADAQKHIAAFQWLGGAQAGHAYYKAEIARADAHYEAVAQANRRPPGGAIQGRDIRQVLSDPRNVITPPVKPAVEYTVPQKKAYDDLNGFANYLKLNGHTRYLEANGQVKGMAVSQPYTNPTDGTPYVKIKVDDSVTALFNRYLNPPPRAAVTPPVVAATPVTAPIPPRAATTPPVVVATPITAPVPPRPTPAPAKAAVKGPIRILSFDFDGCLSNNNPGLDVVSKNREFLEQIKKENAAFGQVYCVVGSNRQSFAIDNENARGHGNGSCFPAIKAVSAHLGATHDPFLLADVYGDLSDGAAYQQAMDPKFPAGNHKNWMFDHTKASILYAQIHKIANEHPGEDIVLDFYDDRSDILMALRDFYKEYPDLIPANVTINLHQYDGKGQAYPMAPLKGKGIIDANYKVTTKELAKLGQLDPNQCDVAKKAQAELLRSRIPLNGSGAPVPPITPSGWRPFVEQGNKIIEIVGKMVSQAISDVVKNPNEENKLANKSMSALSKQINDEFGDVLAGRKNPADFVAICQKAISDAPISGADKKILLDEFHVMASALSKANIGTNPIAPPKIPNPAAAVSAGVPTPVAPRTPEPVRTPPKSPATEFLEKIGFDKFLTQVNHFNQSNKGALNNLYSELLRQKEAFLEGLISKAHFRMDIDAAQKQLLIEIQKPKAAIITSVPESKPVISSRAEEFVKRINFDGVLNQINLLNQNSKGALKNLHSELIKSKEDYLGGVISQADFKMSLEEAKKQIAQMLNKPKPEVLSPKEYLEKKGIQEGLKQMKAEINRLEHHGFKIAADELRNLHGQLNKRGEQFSVGLIDQSTFEQSCRAQIQSFEKKATVGPKVTGILDFLKKCLGLETSYEKQAKNVAEMKKALNDIKSKFAEPSPEPAPENSGGMKMR